jgi:hypothetical protein
MCGSVTRPAVPVRRLDITTYGSQPAAIGYANKYCTSMLLYSRLQYALRTFVRGAVECDQSSVNQVPLLLPEYVQFAAGRAPRFYPRRYVCASAGGANGGFTRRRTWLFREPLRRHR